MGRPVKWHDGPLGLARNPYTVEGNAVTLELTQGQVTVIDLSDAALAFPHHWIAHWITRARRFYVHSTHGGHTIALHTILVGSAVGNQVDHADRDSLNNRRSNLRAATFSGNMSNRAAWGASGLKGVVQSSSGRWRASARFAGASHYLGTYDTAAEAASAYDAAARTLHGAYALTNADLGLL